MREKRPVADWSKGHIVERPLNQASVRAEEQAKGYIKTETAYEYGVPPGMYVTVKEQASGAKKQEDMEQVLRSPLLTTEQRAVLWQLQNTAWKPYKNPFSTSVSQSVLDACGTRKRGGLPSYEELKGGRSDGGLPTFEELKAQQGNAGNDHGLRGLMTFEEFMDKY